MEIDDYITQLMDLINPEFPDKISDSDIAGLESRIETYADQLSETEIILLTDALILLKEENFTKAHNQLWTFFVKRTPGAGLENYDPHSN